MIELIDGPIDVEGLLKYCEDERCGATSLFLGTTRRWTKGIETAYLEYDTYREMAIAQMKQLAKNAEAKWPVKKMAMVHRLGRVDVGQASVAIAVSCPHRADAIAACHWLIDELKAHVPIWKKEWFVVDGPKWIHPGNEPS
ncbi:MAG: molybdenum cofactor biosynthesis protein MoaE [Planctomycetes bacterium]|nr:molybdenum cofactor biosynthesis protein MoaE [Planctomycetota bacterium]